jgi:hypothetical protein
MGYSLRFVTLHECARTIAAVLCHTYKIACSKSGHRALRLRHLGGTDRSQLIKVAYQLPTSAKYLDQFIYHCFIEHEFVRQIVPTSKANHFQIGCRWIAVFKTIWHGAQLFSRHQSVWENRLEFGIGQDVIQTIKVIDKTIA